MSKRGIWIIEGIVALLIVVGIVLLVRTHNTPQTASQSEATASSTSISINGDSGTPPGVSIHELSTIPAPSLTAPVTYDPSLSSDMQTHLQTQITSLRAQLQASPTNGQDWLQLALDYKEAGDYQTAIGVWNYLTKVDPSNYVAFADLGDLYQNFLKDYPKAVANYTTAIKLHPTDVDLYYNLYTLYRYQESNVTAAANIVAQGLKANPGNSTLLQLQSQLQSGQ